MYTEATNMEHEKYDLAIIITATEIVTKGLKKNLEAIPGKRSTYSLQKKNSYTWNTTHNTGSNYLLTYSMEQSPSREAKQLVKKFPEFYGTQKFIAAFKSARHLSLSRARSFQSMPPSHFLKIHFNNILPSMPGSSK